MGLVRLGINLPSEIFDQIMVRKMPMRSRSWDSSDEAATWRIYFYYEGIEVAVKTNLSYDEALEIIQKVDPTATTVREQEITVINEETGEETVVQEGSGIETYYSVSDESDVGFDLPTSIIKETTDFIKDLGSLIPLAGLGLLALLL